MIESKVVATETPDLRSTVYSPAENDTSDHKMAVSCVPGTILKALRSHISFTRYHNYVVVVGPISTPISQIRKLRLGKVKHTWTAQSNNAF